MIAEIYHKISKSGSNLSERLEDELTGNYFGNLRYIPFRRGLGRILAKYVYDEKATFQEVFSQNQDEEWNTEFWKRSDLGYGEIDCYMSGLSGISLGIEVKYRSDLSSEDQLEREAEMLKEWSINGQKLLLFVAPGKEYCKGIYQKNKDKLKLKGVILGFLTWEDALLSLNEIITKNNFEKLIVEDLYNLLCEKGFNGFNGFEIKQFDKNNIDASLVWKFVYETKVDFSFSGFLPIIREDTYEFRRKH